MHFLELLKQVSDRDTAVYYAENCDEVAPKASYSAANTLMDGNYSFVWCDSKQGHKFWAKIHEKLSTHPQNEKVTYEPEVYKQYKNEVFEDVKAVIPNIRDYSVIIKDTSIEDRRKLHSLLYCLDEPMYKHTRLHTDYTTEAAYFRWIGFDGEWRMSSTKGDDKQEITIQDFIAKFSKTKTTAPEMDTFKEYASKDVQHALETKQTKTTKKETFMSKLKTTTLNTLEQNKQAAIIAAKVDAGRIINKQVIKQLKPHVPMLLRGYLDTPLAPVIAANVVAMIGNHTDNNKIKKVSELMLLGAADATVQSFNLDKIIDDVLAGIKLPAGFLDADDN